MQNALDNVTPGVTNTIHLAGHAFDMTNALSWVEGNRAYMSGWTASASGGGRIVPQRWSGE